MNGDRRKIQDVKNNKDNAVGYRYLPQRHLNFNPRPVNIVDYRTGEIKDASELRLLTSQS